MSLQTDATEAAPQRLIYDGRLGELYGIFFVNLLLGIIARHLPVLGPCALSPVSVVAHRL